MRAVARLLRRMVREPFWLFLIAGLIVGVVLGTYMARETTSDLTEEIFGKAWRKNPLDTRSFLMTIFGIQLTVLTIVLSFNVPMIQAAANQYSPRLVPYYLKSVPLRRALPLFVLTGAYLLAAVRQVGLGESDTVRPRVVLSAAVILVVVAFAVLTFGMIRTFRFMRVEHVLALVRKATLVAMARSEARLRRLTLDPDAKLQIPGDAAPLAVSASGYLVEVDVARLTRLARRTGTRVRISRAMGDYLDEGEIVGWVVRDGGAPVEKRVAGRLLRTLGMAPAREPEYDPAYGIRILADVAARALSDSFNDAYTARQALQQLRSVLRRLARAPVGDWNVVDGDGQVRVSVMSTQLREYISIALESSLRFGAGSPEALDGLLEVALEVGLVARDADGRAAAHQLVSRVVDDAVEYGKLSDGRLDRLLAEAELVRASLERDAPRPDRHARSDWGLTPDDGHREPPPAGASALDDRR